MTFQHLEIADQFGEAAPIDAESSRLAVAGAQQLDPDSLTRHA